VTIREKALKDAPVAAVRHRRNGRLPASWRAVVRWLRVETEWIRSGGQHAGSRPGAAIAPALAVFLLY
jgi:hypothetical protein